jgi:hypothetical protein
MTDRPIEDQLANWPNCKTPDCPNKCCRIMESEFCSPCSAKRRGISLKEWSQRIFQRSKELGLSK